MPQVFLCSQCSAKMSVPDGSAGKRVKCPKCNALQTIPNPQDEVVSATLVLSEKQSESTSAFTETGNPWQPPHEGKNLRDSAHERLTLSLIFSRSFSTLMKHIGSLVVIPIIFILAFGVSFAALLVMEWMKWPQSNSPYYYHTVYGIQAFIQLGAFIFELGALAYALHIVKTGETRFSKFFAGLQKFIPCLAYGLIYWIMLVIPNMLIFLGASQATNLIIGFQESNPETAGLFFFVRLALASVPLFVWNSWVSVRFGWGLMVMLDQNVSMTQAFQISWRISRNNTLVLVLSLLLHVVLLSLITVCTLGLGILVTIPYIYCAICVVYCAMMNTASEKDVIEF